MDAMASAPQASVRARPRRADIQGLRAVAVIVVLLYHLKVPGFSGGFVGVDVFFVISGFLITGILWRDSDRSISFTRWWWQFMYRRGLRLMPATIITAIVTFAVAALILSPSTLTTVAASVAASAIGLSNFWFWQHSDYFADDARMQPLIHTWSLAVEWQFYVLWPAVIALAWRLRRRVHPLIVIAIAGAVSLGGNLVFEDSRMAIYYLPWFRAFEFAIGGAGVFLVGVRLPDAVREALALLGIAIIAASTLLLDDTMVFPSYNALLPCFGALLVIVANSKVVGQNTLGAPVMFWTGEISYSIYLVHWPLIVFTEIALVPELSLPHQLVLFACSITGGWLLHSLVEEPFRPKRREYRRAYRTELLFAPLLAAALVVPIHAYWTNGWPWRLDPAMRTALIAAHQSEAPPKNCFFNSGEDYSNFDLAGCMKPVAGKRNVLLIGDSLAAYAYAGFRQHKEWNVMVNTVTGCPPVVGVFPNFGKGCAQRNKDILEHTDRYRADEIYLMGNWLPEQAPALGELLLALRAKGQHVTVIGPPVRFTKKLIDIVSSYRNLADAAAAATRFIPPDMFELDDLYASTAAKIGAEYFSPIKQLCPSRSPKSCTAIIGGKVLLSFDERHMLSAAAEAVFKNLK